MANFFFVRRKSFFFSDYGKEHFDHYSECSIFDFPRRFFSSGDVDNDDDESKTQNFLAPSKEFTIVDVILLHMIVQETNDVESRSDFDDALLDM